jgi:hypothetical protein
VYHFFLFVFIFHSFSFDVPDVRLTKSKQNLNTTKKKLISITL